MGGPGGGRWFGRPRGPGRSWVASRDRVRGEVTSRDCLHRPVQRSSCQAPGAIGRPLSCVIHSALSHSRTARRAMHIHLQTVELHQPGCPHAYEPSLRRLRNSPTASLHFRFRSVRSQRASHAQPAPLRGDRSPKRAGGTVQACATANQTKECIARRSAPFPSRSRAQPWHPNRSESGAPGARVPRPTVVSVVRCQCGRAACGSFLTLIL